LIKPSFSARSIANNLCDGAFVNGSDQSKYWLNFERLRLFGFTTLVVMVAFSRTGVAIVYEEQNIFVNPFGNNISCALQSCIFIIDSIVQIFC
jgi:hypothetical protein